MTIVNQLMKIDGTIPDAVLNYSNQHADVRTAFISFLENFNDEILMRTFAFKKPKNKDLQVTEVTRRVSGSKIYILKNIYFTMLAGYGAVYSQKDIETHNCYMDKTDFDVWYDRDDDYFKVGNYIINPEILQSSKYKYCAFNWQDFLIDYLDLYNQYPSLELFSKLGIRPSKALLKKCSQNKQFRKYLVKNKDKLIRYGVTTMIYAYNHNMTLNEAEEWLYMVKRVPELKGTSINRLRLRDYLDKKNIDNILYDDYLKAIKYLHFDLNDTKNLYPHNFKAMHDLRIQEYDSAKAKEEVKNKHKLNMKLKKVAKEFSKLNLVGKYAVIIATDIKELILEGKALNHCVGRMGYDKKMADKKSLILFVRKVDEREKPFVTMEFQPNNKKILQIYGNHDSRPSKEVMDFVNNQWLPFAKKQLRDAA